MGYLPKALTRRSASRLAFVDRLGTSMLALAGIRMAIELLSKQ
jgi:hypothetical protein